MLRRKPTAITLTSEDVLAYVKSRDSTATTTATAASGTMVNSAFGKLGGPMDPNDELKPLPGDKARIVRAGGAGREERVVGH